MRPPAKVVQIVNCDDDFSVEVVPNIAHNELVAGPSYLPKGIRLSVANALGVNTSGVLGKCNILLDLFEH